MARPARIEYEGAVYHVAARGNERRTIFTDDIDRERFLAVLGPSVEQFEVRPYLYCLMTNHFHLWEGTGSNLHNSHSGRCVGKGFVRMGKGRTPYSFRRVAIFLE